MYVVAPQNVGHAKEAPKLTRNRAVEIVVQTGDSSMSQTVPELWYVWVPINGKPLDVHDCYPAVAESKDTMVLQASDPTTHLS